MPYLKSYYTIFFIALCSSYSSAASLPVSPGLWESTSTTTDPFSGRPITETNVECFKETQVSVEDILEEFGECSISEKTLSNNTLNFLAKCLSPDAQANIQGQYTVEGKTSRGEMNIAVKIGESTFDSEIRWNARRMGDCPSNQ
ncbi:DUF3617 domain-containing protein [Marinibactrum halimedae]|uniref:DUF3617 family protein n=1 Tax=Marinibactrum halimedae TaxID=1444977 RepID=A0AA37WL09_9GAMM|nr:DUF3617 family protein [Marinibactrum halimedae]MCD9457517.1 DUF3617 domain-containing protein [Marinibactrum halimedae]GLS25429.1 hypothetical protein GCM10007877_11430 [Marinibactrum halimedae]